MELNEEENNLMWIEVNLKTFFYQPEKIEKGMWFINSLNPGTDREFFEVWELEEDVEDYDEFITRNGFPVDLLITVEVANPDDPDDIIVYSENIGWVSDDENNTMDIVDIKFVNDIIENYNGKVFLLIDESIYDDLDEIVPEMENELVILSYPFEEEYDEEFEN